MTHPRKTTWAVSVLVALACLIFATNAKAANFQTVHAGNWSDPTVWGFPAGSGIFPGSGGTARPDTVVITFPTFVDVSPTIGLGSVLNQPFSYDLIVAATLTIGTGEKLSLRGGAQAYAPLIINAGGGFLFDSSVSHVTYTWRCNNDSSAFVANGTAAARCSLSGGFAGAYIQNAQLNATVHATFTDFTSFGCSSGVYSSGGTEYTLEDCTFTGCGVSSASNIPPTVKLSIQRNTWTNSSNGTSLVLYTAAPPSPGVAHIVNGNVFDGIVRFETGVNGLTITYNYFNAGYTDGLVNARWASFAYNFIRQTNDGVPLDGDAYDNYFFYDSPTTVDCNTLGNTDVGNVLAYGNIFEARTAANLGCWAYVGVRPLSAQTTFTFRNNISIPNATPNIGASGLLVVSQSPSPLIKLVVEHNTGFAAQGFLRIGDITDTTSAGSVLSCRSNLVWNNTPGGGNLIYEDNGRENLPDVCPPQMMGYNGGFLLAPSNPGANLVTQPLKLGYGGFNPNLFSQTPIADTTDVDADPMFVDSARNLAKWDASLGGPGTPDHAMAQLMAVHQVPNSPYTTANLITYVRVGFQPTNTAFRAAGHDRVDIGAMPVFIPPVAVNKLGKQAVPSISNSPTMSPANIIRRRAR